jgi:hypothetical protein
LCSLIVATATEGSHVLPPSVERNARMPAPPSYVTTTVPFGCTTGCPPIPLEPGVFFGPHVRPPSLEVLM